jgi:hypothetical protein
MVAEHQSQCNIAQKAHLSKIHKYNKFGIEPFAETNLEKIPSKDKTSQTEWPIDILVYLLNSQRSTENIKKPPIQTQNCASSL